MTVLNRIQRNQPAPALFRLLAESALSRAALEACAFPLALLDAGSPSRAITYVNAAFAAFFGWSEADALGASPVKLLFRGDEAALQRLLADPGTHWRLETRGKDGEARYVELAIAAVRSVEGSLTHWVLSFSDCGELERMRAELEKLRAGAVSP